MWLQQHRRIVQLVFLSALSGVLLAFSFPKAGAGFLAWFALFPFFLALREGTDKENLLSGLSFGIAHFLTLLYWVVYTLNIYGYIPMILCVPILFLLVLYLSLYPSVFAWFSGRFMEKPWQFVLFAPVFWVCLEYLKAEALTGFPWELLGYSQHRSLHIIQIADITGVYGVSYLVAFVNSAVFTVYVAVSGLKWRGNNVTIRTAVVSGLTALTMVGLVWSYDSLRIGETDKAIAAANTAKISVVQGNIDQSLKWNQSFQLETLAKYGRLSYAASKEKPDLIVWPETAAPFYYTNDKYLTYKIKETFRNCGTEFLIGFPSYTSEMGSFKFFNSAYIMNPEGMIEGTYSKTHLVPFGEYVPLQDFLPFIHKLTEQSGDFYPGEKGNTLDFANGKIGTQICFEVIFPELSRAMVSNGAQLIANITNDAWFGKSSAPFQHFSMVKFRAVENKRAIARAANTGISGFIDPLGRELAASDLYVDAQLTRSLPLLNTLTFYTRFGDVFVWGLFLVFAPFAAVRIRQKGFRKRKTPEAPK